MSIIALDLQGLLRRAQVAQQRGYEIALGDHYARALGGTDGSAAGLVTLCHAALSGDPVAPVETPTWPPSAAGKPVEPAPEETPPAPVPDEPIELAELVDPTEPEDTETPSEPPSADGTSPKKASRRRRAGKA
jgi:hypothetical protein